MASAAVEKTARGAQAPAGDDPKLEKELSDIVERSEKTEERKDLRWGYAI